MQTFTQVMMVVMVVMVVVVVVVVKGGGCRGACGWQRQCRVIVTRARCSC